MERILHAAVWSEAQIVLPISDDMGRASLMLFMGKCHADCFHKASHLKIKMSQKAEHQGFVTSLGVYVGRHEAYKIALAAGQIEPSAPLDPEIYETTTPRIQFLFSEDLWSPKDGGKYDYDEIKGYVER